MMPPLAEQLRPQTLEEVVGQPHLVGPDGFITSIIKTGTPLSIILWGPPGSGKTSIARLYAKSFSLRFETLSAVFSGIADLRRIIKEIEDTPLLGKGVVLFVDESTALIKHSKTLFCHFWKKERLSSLAPPPKILHSI